MFIMWQPILVLNLYLNEIEWEKRDNVFQKGNLLLLHVGRVAQSIDRPQKSSQFTMSRSKCLH